MIALPDFERTFEYENGFYLTCDSSRISKMLAHYELYKMVHNLEGAIIECGVFKGASLVRFAAFRDLFDKSSSKNIIGFDVFAKFPETNFTPDKEFRRRYIDSAGEDSISKEQLIDVLKHKGIDRGVELVEGNITNTLPAYLALYPELKISLLNLDVDIYEPAVTVLEYFYPRITRGGLLLLDDYGIFPGETKAVDEYFEGKDIKIRRLDFRKTPSYIVKE